MKEKKKVLLVSPKNVAWTGAVTLPLNLAYLASSLEEGGHEVKCIDMRVDENIDIQREIENFDIVGISSCTPSIKEAWKIASIAKKCGRTVVLGGPHPTALPNESLQKNYVDMVVRGEGEITIREICDGLKPRNIKGISFRVGKKIFHNVDRPFIQNLDSLPFPARHLFDLRKYHSSLHKNKIVGDILTCYDDQTEVLTEDGWKFFKDLTYEDDIATLNHENHNLEYQKPSKLMSYDYNGDMCKIECKQINLLITPNHKLYVRLRSERPNKFTLIDASILMNKNNFRMKKDAIWIGDEQDYFILPKVLHNFNPINKTRKSGERAILMGLWLEFLGYYLSEGSVQHKKSNNSWIVKISQKRGTESYRKMEECIKKLGYKYYKHPKEGFFISNKQLCCYLKQFGHAQDKFIPKEIKQLSDKHLKILLDALVLGDGCVSNGVVEYITTSKKLIDDIQEVLLKVGWSGNIKNKPLSKGKINGRIINPQLPCYFIVFNKKQNMPVINYTNNLGRHKHISKENYLGKVYCCEVPNHIIYVRRKGKPVWSGNSRGCPYGCNFCFKAIFGRYYRMRSPENVIEEWKQMIGMGIEEIGILDDNFTVDKQRAIKICNEIKKQKLIADWSAVGGIRVDSVSKELFTAMKNAGCYRVAFGAESGSQYILDENCKGTKLEQIRDAVKLAKEFGFEITLFFMIGNLHENRETMQKTIDFAKELDPDFVQFTIATPYPGTALYDIVKREGRLIVKDWEEYGSYEGKAYFEHGELNKKLVEGMYRKAYRDFYLRPRIMMKYIKNHRFEILKGFRFLTS